MLLVQKKKIFFKENKFGKQLNFLKAILKSIRIYYHVLNSLQNTKLALSEIDY